MEIVEKMNDIEKLRKDIEAALSHPLQTPRDFNHLSKRIYARLHVMVSVTSKSIIKTPCCQKGNRATRCIAASSA